MTEHLQLTGRHKGVLLSENKLLHMELKTREEQVLNLVQQNKRFTSQLQRESDQADMIRDELDKNKKILGFKNEEIQSLQKAWSVSQTKLEATRQETEGLHHQVKAMGLKCESISTHLQELWSERDKVKATLQEVEKELDKTLQPAIVSAPQSDDEVCTHLFVAINNLLPSGNETANHIALRLCVCMYVCKYVCMYVCR